MKNIILFLTNKGILILLTFTLGSLQSCKSYYIAQTAKTVNAKEIKAYDSADKYIILHQDTMFWHLSGIEVNDEILSGLLTVVPYDRQKFNITNPKAVHRYTAADQYYVLDQVHLYLQDSVVPVIDSSGHYKVALKDIKKIEVYQNDDSRITPSSGASMVLGGALAAFVLIGALTFSTFHLF